MRNNKELEIEYSKTEEEVDYKAAYEYGLALLKDSLKEVKSCSYKAILPYFNYPLSIIEEDVRKAKNNNTDTNAFYKGQCDELFKMYDRLLKTSLICASELGTKNEKIRANKVLDAIKSVLNEQKSNSDKEEITEHKEKRSHVKVHVKKH